MSSLLVLISYPDHVVVSISATILGFVFMLLVISLFKTEVTLGGILGIVFLLFYFSAPYWLLQDEGFSWLIHNNRMLRFTGSPEEYLEIIVVAFFAASIFLCSVKFSEKVFGTYSKNSYRSSHGDVVQAVSYIIRPYQRLWIVLLIVQFPINLWMFSNRMGVVGFDPEIRFGIFPVTGALYYYRYYIFPLVELFALLSVKRKNLVACLIIVEALVAGFSGLSRSLLVLHSSAIFIGAFLPGVLVNRLVLFGSAVVVLLGYEFITLVRIAIYLPGFDSFSVQALWEMMMDTASTTDVDVVEILGSVPWQIYSRIVGLREFIIVYFSAQEAQSGYGYHLLIEYFFGMDATKFPNYFAVKELWGSSLDEFGGYGVDVLGNCYRGSGSLVALPLVLFVLGNMVAQSFRWLIEMFDEVSLPRELASPVLAVAIFKFLDGWVWQIVILGLSCFIVSFLFRRRAYFTKGNVSDFR